LLAVVAQAVMVLVVLETAPLQEEVMVILVILVVLAVEAVQVLVAVGTEPQGLLIMAEMVVFLL
jgi:hypothetical protein